MVAPSLHVVSVQVCICIYMYMYIQCICTLCVSIYMYIKAIYVTVVFIVSTILGHKACHHPLLIDCDTMSVGTCTLCK